MARILGLLSVLLAVNSAFGAPAAPTKRSVTALSATQLSSLAPFTQFARAAYCPSSSLKNWSCGQACSALTGFQPTLVGGDGNGVQVYYVGYWPAQNTVVVAHEGTDPTQLVSVLTDANILTDALNTNLFPGVSSSVLVHDGFRNEHALTAPTILAEVKRLMASENTKSVTTVGHSLGGALAELDALFLTLNLPSDTSIQSITFGTPRVGNAAFAQLIDAKVPNFKRVNNEKDIVPIVPGNAISCSGDDDATDSQCQIETVPNIFEGNILDHLGPYEGISIGTIFCT